MLRLNCKSPFLFVPLLFLVTIAFAQEPDTAGRTNLFSVRLTCSPLGYFLYAADAGSHTNWFECPLHELTLQVEYYLVPQWGLELTIDFKGYAWDTMSSPYPFVNFWGVPGFKVGVGAVQHPLPPESIFDLTLAAGIEGGLFWEDETYQ